MLRVAEKLCKLWFYGLARTAVAALCAHSVSISIGIVQGYSAIWIPQLMSNSSTLKIDSEQASWLASLGAISNPIGSVLSGMMAEMYGRKLSMQMSSVPFILGWVIIGTSKRINWLYIGRLITGIAAGMSTASYTYVTEISTPEHRGIFQSLGPICASFGILLTYTMGYFVHWNFLAYAFVTFSVVTVVGAYFIPESPAWLTKKYKTEEAMNSLIWFRRSNSLAQAEFDELAGCRQKVVSKEDLRGFYLGPTAYKPFVILVFFFLCQEVSGIYTILFYAVSFFKDASVNIDVFVASIIVGVIRFAMSILVAVLIRHFPRKTLCVVSASGMALSMLATAAYIKYTELHPGFHDFRLVPLICVLLNVFFSMIGMLPIPWIMVGELFPLEVRGILSGLVVCLGQVFIFTCIKIHPTIVEHLKFSGALFIMAGASVLTIFFVKFFLPETKDKTLAEIEDSFKNKKIDVEENGVDNACFDSSGEITIKL